MARLSTTQRKAMPQGEYALPGKRFPINDDKHARAAIMLSNKGTTPGEAATVRAKAQAKLGRIKKRAAQYGGIHNEE